MVFILFVLVIIEFYDFSNNLFLLDETSNLFVLVLIKKCIESRKLIESILLRAGLLARGGFVPLVLFIRNANVIIKRLRI